MNKTIFFLIFVAIGALAYGWWHNRSALQAHNEEKVQAFISAGPRFTAQDGQNLCEIILEIAKHSIGFQKSGKPLPECNYSSRK